MVTNKCGHADRTPFGRICLHLLDSKDAEHYKRFTGMELTYDLVCANCSRDPGQIEVGLANVCSECFHAIEGDRWQEEGIVGKPEVLTRPSTLRFEHEKVDLPELVGLSILEVQPIEGSPGSWLACISTGALVEIIPAQRSVRVMAQVPLEALEFDGPNIREPQRAWPGLAGPACALRVSYNGELAAIANRYGQKGVVMDLATGKVAMSLLRDEYHADVSTFPLAFVDLDKRVLLIHGTEWNRLDVSDPRTGTLLTERGPTSHKRGEVRPEHYLDYFHCSLSVSPGQKYLSDN
jgi:hypothetical protein